MSGSLWVDLGAVLGKGEYAAEVAAVGFVGMAELAWSVAIDAIKRAASAKHDSAS